MGDWVDPCPVFGALLVAVLCIISESVWDWLTKRMGKDGK